jgi:hypothetical protein
MNSSWAKLVSNNSSTVWQARWTAVTKEYGHRKEGQPGVLQVPLFTELCITCGKRGNTVYFKLRFSLNSILHMERKATRCTSSSAFHWTLYYMWKERQHGVLQAPLFTELYITYGKKGNTVYFKLRFSLISIIHMERKETRCTSSSAFHWTPYYTMFHITTPLFLLAMTLL